MPTKDELIDSMAEVIQSVINNYGSYSAGSDSAVYDDEALKNMAKEVLQDILESLPDYTEDYEGKGLLTIDNMNGNHYKQLLAMKD